MCRKRVVALLTVLMLLVTLIPTPSNTADAESVSTYIYKTEYGSAKWISTKCYPVGQKKSGAKFSSGGGFWYEDGNDTSVSVTCSFPAKYGSLDISVPFGSVGGKMGYYVKAPDKKSYWKLQVTKKVKVKPYVVYRKLRYKSNAKWEKYYVGTKKLDEKISFKCVKVK